MAGYPDFSGLREEIESATVLPAFDLITGRARRIRRRSRLAALGSMVAVLLIIGPAGALAALNRPPQYGPTGIEESPLPVGPDRPSATPAPTADTPAQVNVAAVAGVDLDHLFALVDVCHGDACNLQLVPVRKDLPSSVGPAKIDLLRDSPTQLLSDVRLQALTGKLLLVSGDIAGERRYRQIDVSQTEQPVVGATPLVGDRAVQLSDSGSVAAFNLTNGRMSPLSTQPPVNDPELVDTLLAGKGFWVTGTDPVTGQVAVAVSADKGRTWTERSLGLPPSSQAPVFASYDGHTAYLLSRADTGDFSLLVTTDGGYSWQRCTGALPWPEPIAARADFGLVVRPDGSILAWLVTGPGVAYLQSAAGGGHFTAVDNGPGGPVYALPDGYVSAALSPQVSRDAATWVPAKLPYLSR